ncbi:MAG: HU family DNA-binding protein [Planctomycetaceae bacterium]|jgi:nucleoid DNA-binding protein|nr:HU family DNA-binding protein [Planctomycetaceae bacterium]
MAEAKKPLTKTEIVAVIAESTSVSKKDVNAVIEALGNEIKKSLGKKGPGSFALPGLFKVEKKHKKAVPAKKDCLNRLTGTTYDRPAKPAHDVVKIRPLKALKEAV